MMRPRSVHENSFESIGPTIFWMPEATTIRIRRRPGLPIRFRVARRAALGLDLEGLNHGRF
jgi:hypothetical protein